VTTANNQPKKATTDDIGWLAQTLGRAFEDDPIFGWLLPDDKTRLDRITKLHALELEKIFLRHDATWTTADRTGAAIWAPPGKWRVKTSEEIRNLPGLIGCLGRRLIPGLRLFEHVAKFHPREPHWYLAVLGTEPAHQGKGIGSALLQPVLERCDAELVPAYLESSKEANIAFYRRHGFEVRDEITMPGGPTVWPMWRDPRPDG
jgi:ribosomal protein S18 acetylase RimI-like enzyme